MRPSYKELKWLDEELLPMLRQLKFHHLSQSKPHSDPCSKRYNKDLANKLAKAEKRVKDILGG